MMDWIEATRIPGHVASARVGSEYIFPGRPENNDIDVVLLTRDPGMTAAWLLANGWEKQNPEMYAELGSWRKDKGNFILTESFAFYQAFICASELCRWLVNSGATDVRKFVADRNMRVDIHKKIRAMAVEVEKVAEEGKSYE